MTRHFLSLTVTLTLISVVVVLAWQRQEAHVLRTEIEVLRVGTRDFQEAQAENARLRREHIAADELGNLRADHAAIARLREEVEKLKAGAR